MITYEEWWVYEKKRRRLLSSWGATELRHEWRCTKHPRIRAADYCPKCRKLMGLWDNHVKSYLVRLPVSFDDPFPIELGGTP